MNPTTESPRDPIRDALLAARLDEVKGALGTLEAPPRLEATLASAFRQQHAGAAPKRPRLWWMPPLALAATLALVSWMLRAPSGVAPPASGASSVEDSDPGPFLALRPLDRIALEPGTTVVASEFPRALLADWGLPVAPERAGEPVRAEMLYSADGEPLAVRLIH